MSNQNNCSKIADWNKIIKRIAQNVVVIKVVVLFFFLEIFMNSNYLQEKKKKKGKSVK